MRIHEEAVKPSGWGLLARHVSESDSPLRIPASEFARVYHKTVQAIHEWAKNGLITELGYTFGRDVTHHLFIFVPLRHEYYQIFFYRKYLDLYQRYAAKWKEIRYKWQLLAYIAGTIWHVTGEDGLEPAESQVTKAQWEEIGRRMGIVFSTALRQAHVRKLRKLTRLQIHN